MSPSQPLIRPTSPRQIPIDVLGFKIRRGVSFTPIDQTCGMRGSEPRMAEEPATRPSERWLKCASMISRSRSSSARGTWKKSGCKEGAWVPRRLPRGRPPRGRPPRGLQSPPRSRHRCHRHRGRRHGWYSREFAAWRACSPNLPGRPGPVASPRGALPAPGHFGPTTGAVPRAAPASPPSNFHRKPRGP